MIFNIVSNKNKASIIIKKELLIWIKKNKLDQDDKKFLFIIGGDGFFLQEFKKVFDQDIYVIFINSGTLGYYSYVKKINEMNLNDVLNKNKYSTLDILKVTIGNKHYFCMNDFSFYNHHTSHMELYVNDFFVQKTFGNGFLVATTLGSTARNKSLNGPIIFPSNQLMVFNEIETIHNHLNQSINNPLIFNENDELNFKLFIRGKNLGVFLIDGIEILNDNKNTIKINMISSKAKLLFDTDYGSYIKRLRKIFLKEVDNGK